jgi:hypothetical protein
MIYGKGSIIQDASSGKVVVSSIASTLQRGYYVLQGPLDFKQVVDNTSDLNNPLMQQPGMLTYDKAVGKMKYCIDNNGKKEWIII